MPELYFESTHTGKKFEVVRFDQAAGTVTLKGEHGQFTEPFDKQRFVDMGYELKQG